MNYNRKSPKGYSALIILIVAALAPDLQAGATPDGELDNLFHDYIEKRFEMCPLEATRLGDHRFDNRLPDLSANSRRLWTRHTKQTLHDLKAKVDFRRLSRPAQIDYEIFRHNLETELWLDANTQPYTDDPRLYNEYLADSVYLVLAQSTLPPEVNISNAIARIEQLPRIINDARRNLGRPPRTVLETAVQQNRGSIRFYESGILDFVGNSPQRAAVQAAASHAANLLRDYQQFLEKDLQPRATGNWRLGKDRFAKKLDLELNAGIKAPDVLASAEAEYSRVLAEMYVIARQLWPKYQPDKPLPPDDAGGRRTTIARVLEAISHEHGQPDGFVQDVREAVDRIREFIRSKDFLRLPDPDRCQVIEMPEFQRGHSVAYLNSAPPLDPAAPSFYAVSPPGADWEQMRIESLLQEYNRHMLQILTIHEAYPGHYVQLEYANRAGSLIRRVLSSGPFIEGWAVYTEQAMLDHGYGGGDLALRLTQLKFYLRAVVNAILDHRMHCTQMTDQEALKLLVDGAFQSEEEARLKIVRAKQSSCQLSTYFAGRMAIYNLRRTLQAELGDQFNLGKFHEAVLAHGSVPVKYLPELVRARLQQPR